MRFFKNKQLKKRFLITLGAIAVVGFFLYTQYQSYLYLPKLDRTNHYYTIPVNNTVTISRNWQYFSINYENLDTTKAPEEQFIIETSPRFEHKVYYASQKDLTLKSLIATNSLEQAKQELGDRFEEFNQRYNTIPMLVVERVDPPFNPNTTYTITVRQKQFNLVSFLTNSYSLSYSFKTDANLVNENTIRSDTFFSSVGSFLIGPTKEQRELQKKIDETCRLSSLDSLFLPVDDEGNPTQDPLNFEYYDLKDLKCDTVNYTGESITVVLKSPQGRAKFEKFLKDNNVNLKLLKITYITR